MFIQFTCCVCNKKIQADEAFVGEWVECPLCGSVEVVPDPGLPPGNLFHGYQIKNALDSSLLWITYHARSDDGHGGHVLLKVPTTFIKRRVDNFGRFIADVIRDSVMGKTEFPSIQDKCLVEGKEFMVFSSIPDPMSVSAFVDEWGALNCFDAIQFLRKAALALQWSHDKREQSHCFLNPGNILINQDFNVQIVNMGVAKAVQNQKGLLRKNINLWEPMYTHPQFDLTNQDKYVEYDIYSLGAIFYLVLTGHHAYEDAELSDIQKALFNNPQDFDPGIPDSYVSLIDNMIDPDSPDGFDSWDSLIGEIDFIIEEESTLPEGAEGLDNEFFTGEYDFSEFDGMQIEPMGHITHKVPPKKKKKKKTPKRRRGLTLIGSTQDDTIAKVAPTDTVICLHKPYSAFRPFVVAVFALAITSVLFSLFLIKIFTDQSEIQEKFIVNSNPRKHNKRSRSDHVAVTQKNVETTTSRLQRLRQEKKDLMRIIAQLKMEVADDIAQKRFKKARAFLESYKGSHAETTRAAREELLHMVVEAEAHSTSQDLIDKRQYKEALECLDKAIEVTDSEDLTKMREALERALNRQKGLASVRKKSIELASEGKYQEALSNLVYSGRFTENTEEFNAFHDSLTKKIMEMLSDRVTLAQNWALMGKPEKADMEIKRVVSYPYGKIEKKIEEIKQLISAELKARKQFEQILNLVGSNLKDFDAIKDDNASLDFERMTLKDVNKLIAALDEFQLDEKDSLFYRENKKKFESFKEACRKAQEALIAKSVNNRITVYPGQSLTNVIKKAKAGSKIMIRNGVYPVSRLLISKFNMELRGQKGVVIKGDLVVTGNMASINSIHIKDGGLYVRKVKNADFSYCFVEGITDISGARKARYDNCLFRGIAVTESEKVLFDHCSFLTPEKRSDMEASLIIRSENVEIRNSIIDGRYIGIMFSAVDNPQTRRIVSSVWHGGEGIAVRQDQGVTLDRWIPVIQDPDSLDSLCNQEKNTFAAPQFRSSFSHDWRIAPGTSGYLGAEDGHDCGVIWTDEKIDEYKRTHTDESATEDRWDMSEPFSYD